MSDDLPQHKVRRADSERLFIGGSWALVVACGLAWWKSPANFNQVLIGIAILVLGCAPGLAWAKNSRPWFPCFEIAMLTSVVFFAVPLLNAHLSLQTFEMETVITAGLLVLAYQVCAMAAFHMIRRGPQTPRWALDEIIPEGSLRFLPIGLAANSLYVYLDRFTDLLSGSFSGTLRALTFGLGILSAFIMACEWGRGRLSSNGKAWFVVGLGTQVLILFSALYLINGVSLLVLAAIGYTTTRRRLPLIPMIVILPFIAVLHSGKSDMRSIYWNDISPLPAISGLPEFFGQWVEFGFAPGEEQDVGMAAKLAERASLIQMLCLCVDQVPEKLPFLEGESYVDLPAQVIPRFLWPDKPSSLMANVRLAIYFGLVDPDDPFSTSIAFGVVSEAYTNFGWFGVLILGVLTGWGFKQVALGSVGAPRFSGIGIFVVLLTAWSFQAEQVLATWLTSLFQASVISIGIPTLWRRFFG